MNLEEMLTESIQKEKEKKRETKLLLAAELIIGFFALAVLIGSISLVPILELGAWKETLIVAAGIFIFVCCILFCVKIEQVAGYYQCAKCKHGYIPAFWRVLISMHVGRTRFMKCPHCKKRSWQKKRLEK